MRMSAQNTSHCGSMADMLYYDLIGTYILRGGPLDEAQTLLDDHIIKSRAMSASPFAKPFAADILPWVTRLTRLNAILEQWLTCQVQLLHASHHPLAVCTLCLPP